MADESVTKPKPEWPIKGATVKLMPKYDPPTINASIIIGMEAIVYVPDLEMQKAGFTPYKKVDGKPVDATSELMAHYAGIYKRIVNL